MQKFFNWFTGILFVNIVVLNKLDWDFTPIGVLLVCGLMFVAGAVSLIRKEGIVPPIAWACVLAPPCTGTLGALELLHSDVHILLFVCLFTGFVALFWFANRFRRASH